MSERRPRPHGEPLASAQLRWDEEGQPLSEHFDDVYFSKHNGLQETEYVFLSHNRLPERWPQLGSGARFTIAETGFGTGLNFLAAWRLWEKLSPADATLHFISVEKHPLNPEDLRRALHLWPTLAEHADALIAAYPPACPGFHRLEFAEGRVVLTLLFGEASSSFAQLNAAIDAWFLDGFAPAKNPQMWSDELFRQVARLSRPDTTFSTFTAAGLVRRALQAIGFEVEKVPGFGRKREMLRGRQVDRQEAPHPLPWFELPEPPRAERAIILGGGLAGCASARALAQRGWRVTLIDRHRQLADGASGNPQGALYFKPGVQPSPANRIHLAGYLYSLRLLQQRLGDQRGQSWDPCGVLQLAHNAEERARQTKLLASDAYSPPLLQEVDAQRASELSGVPQPHGGLWFPSGAWVDPRRLCQSLAQHAGIELCLRQDVARIAFDPETRCWQLYDQHHQCLQQAPVLILACAHEAIAFPGCERLPLKPIRGQVTYLEAPAHTPELKQVLCGEGYVSPPRAGRYCFGASFNLHEQSATLSLADHAHNLNLLQGLYPGLAKQGMDTLEQLEGRVGFRCTTPDYLPLLGPVPDREAYLRDYAALRVNAKAKIDTPATHLPGLYLNLGHGSKGLVTAPLCAELLASQIHGDPLPLEQPLVDALNPARFLIKDLARRTI